MTRPKLSLAGDGARRARLRADGFEDGKQGKPKRSSEPDYLISYRRGREQAQQVPNPNPPYEC